MRSGKVRVVAGWSQGGGSGQTNSGGCRRSPGLWAVRRIGPDRGQRLDQPASWPPTPIVQGSERVETVHGTNGSLALIVAAARRGRNSGIGACVRPQQRQWGHGGGVAGPATWLRVLSLHPMAARCFRSEPEDRGNGVRTRQAWWVVWWSWAWTGRRRVLPRRRGRRGCTGGAGLRVVHAFMSPAMHVPWDRRRCPPEGGIGNMVERLVTEAVERARTVAPGVDVSHVVVTGEPLTALESQSCAAGLVVDSRGMGGFVGLLVGSTAVYLAAHGRCPLLVAREQHGDGPSGAEEASLLVTILLGRKRDRRTPMKVTRVPAAYRLPSCRRGAWMADHFLRLSGHCGQGRADTESDGSPLGQGTPQPRGANQSSMWLTSTGEHDCGASRPSHGFGGRCRQRAVWKR